MKISKTDWENILVGPGHITASEFNDSWEAAKKQNCEFSDAVIDNALITSEQLGQLMGEFLEYPLFRLKQEKINDEIFKAIPEIVARAQGVIAFDKKGTEVKIAMLDPENEEIKDNLEKKFDCRLKVYLIDRDSFAKVMQKYQTNLATELKELVAKLDNDQNLDKDSTPIVTVVDRLLQHGYISGASDIHIEPRKDLAIVRFRIDGVMHKVYELPRRLYEPIVIRLKVLSRLRTDEHSAPQDGKFQFSNGAMVIDVRVSLVPVTNGENLVLRLLAPTKRSVDISSLGLSETDIKKVKAAITNRMGMILVVGPTGSGKTTTLYEILKLLNNESVHIATIEDPVEYQIEGVSQIQVNSKIGLTFAKGLRSIVRQDPDIVMIGEVRDEETAEIAINSALTGHLVFSSLHANTAAGAIPRLLDMGIEPFLLSSTLRVIIGQRLVRQICEKCRASTLLTAEEKLIIRESEQLRAAFAKIFEDELDNAVVYRGQGCQLCQQTGFSGRVGIFEVMEMSSLLKEQIIKTSDSDTLEKAAVSNGMTALLEDGFTKVWQGTTTFSEVLRVIK